MHGFLENDGNGGRFLTIILESTEGREREREKEKPAAKISGRGRQGYKVPSTRILTITDAKIVHHNETFHWIGAATVKG